MKRARNQEVIRQWKLVFAIEGARFGKSIDDLSGELQVSTRTIRRDLAALQEAGFPLEDHKRDGRTVWKLNRDGFRDGLVNAGFTLGELSALYFSRAMLEYLAGTPFHDDLRSAFDKFEEVLSPGMKAYLDDLPGVLIAKAEPYKRRDATFRDLVKRATAAVLEHRVVTMRYHSFQSRAVKDYTIEPYQLAYGQGGLYLLAFVPAYGEIRTFAVERIHDLRVEEGRFEPRPERLGEAFANSMGINNTGRPEQVAIEFTPTAAPYVQERQWHKSQEVEARPDGSVVVRLRVVVDWALMAWVLSFGPFARVVEPRHLAERILERLEDARLLYAPQLSFDSGSETASLQRRLPLDRKPRNRARTS
jgi:predicted DNA-binding transcriptional regulator YafY